MDSLNPEFPPVTAIPIQRAPRVWKILGTLLWGLFIFAAMFAGQLAVVAWFVLQGKTVRYGAAIHVPRRRADDFAFRHHGIASGRGRLLDRDPAIAHAVCRNTSRCADLVKNFALGLGALVVLVTGWDLLSRVLGREITPASWRRPEIGAGRRRAVAIGDRVLRGGAMSEEFFARGFLYRGWSDPPCAPWAQSSCRRWPGPAAPAIRLVLLRRGVFDAACCSATCATAPTHLADGRAARPHISLRRCRASGWRDDRAV